MNSAGSLFHKPTAVIAARNILYASLFLAVIGLLLTQFVSDLPGFPNVTIAIANGVLIIAMYIAIRFIGFGKKWARTLLVILFILHAVAAMLHGTYIFNASLLLGFLFILQLLLQIVAIVFLFSHPAREWFNRFETEAVKTRQS